MHATNHVHATSHLRRSAAVAALLAAMVTSVGVSTQSSAPADEDDTTSFASRSWTKRAG